MYDIELVFTNLFIIKGLDQYSLGAGDVNLIVFFINKEN
jgi:hypothetical protein